MTEEQALYRAGLAARSFYEIFREIAKRSELYGFVLLDIEEIARYVGINLPSAYRHMAVLKKYGLIRLGKMGYYYPGLVAEIGATYARTKNMSAMSKKSKSARHKLV